MTIHDADFIELGVCFAPGEQELHSFCPSLKLYSFTYAYQAKELCDTNCMRKNNGMGTFLQLICAT